MSYFSSVATSTPSTSVSTHICELKEGMGKPQYLNEPDINGQHSPSTPNINPGGEGVTFQNNIHSIEIAIAAGLTPIIEYVSIANSSISNVNRINVTIITSSPPYTQTFTSYPGETVVTGFPTIPLPSPSSLLINFETSDDKPPRYVTISIIACFHPELPTTAVASTSLASTTKGTWER